MTDIVNIPVRTINSLELVKNLPLNLNTLRGVKTPIGNLPDELLGEALTLEQIARIVANIAVSEGLVAETQEKGGEILVTQIPITQPVIRLNIPKNRYAVVEPIVLCTVIGGITEVNIVGGLELVPSVGEVFTHVILTFPAALIGKKCNVWLSGGY